MTCKFYLLPNHLKAKICFNLIDKSGKKIDLCTSLEIDPEEWDSLRQRPKNIYKKNNKKLNKILNTIKLYVSEYALHCNREKTHISKKAIANFINKICNDDFESLPGNSLLQYMMQYINSKKDLISYSTYHRYMVFYNLVEKFQGEICKHIYIEDIDSTFATEFLKFGNKENYSTSTIYRTIKFVKTILNFAERKGIRTNVKELEIGREKQYKEIITLNEEEIFRIRNTPVSPDLEIARDWLLISCYTGQRFSDFIHFSTEQIVYINSKPFIFFIQQKTHKHIQLPLHPVVSEILLRNNSKFPEPLSMKIYNEQIKEIAKISKIDQLIYARKRTGFRSLETKIEKWKAISSHIGRRSFATNFYGKIPTPLLMQATGHSSEQIFLKYINPTDNEKLISLGNYFEKIYNLEKENH
ncbi:phage integrase SAM-like domain-containing protein [Chryseobacterium hispalense]|uniref:phage integrase SAM-like domain-containing protein n=1 Tax=Chryseobacterium hispalense TaxID=1453492 RepID=UPI0004932E27|nr:phage integrase SAM-like domain-containing protein [Chryseobacterium hispalense]